MSTSCLLWILRKIKKEFNVRFVIPPAVRRECVDNAIKSKRWGLGAQRIKHLIKTGVVEVENPDELSEVTNSVIELSNDVFQAKGRRIDIIHEGEAEVVALANILGAETICVDEKTTRLLIEKPKNLHQILGSKLHTKVSFNKGLMVKIRESLPGKIRLRTVERGANYPFYQSVIRSTEIISVAYANGLMTDGNVEDGSMVLEMALWALRFAGCSISSQEIRDYVKLFE